jgi:NTP pyrophosphatase (non-canonical NTP hydrolase)
VDELARLINVRIATAEARYGDFASTHEALGVASEEWDELRAAVGQNDLPKVEAECLDLAAVLIRLAETLRTSEVLRRRSVK